jgi:aerobic C4-dicarboxylate transport protein
LRTPTTTAPADTTRHSSFYGTLYFRVLIGILAGVALGAFYPHAGAAMKPFGDGFLKLIRMLVAPIVFFTVVVGIANVGDLRRLGRVGLKSLVYFEVVTTFALLLGLAAASILQPGRGLNASAATLDTKGLAQYTAPTAHLTTTDFLLNIIPDSFAGAFTRGEMLQVLLLAILSGIALALLRSSDNPVADHSLEGVSGHASDQSRLTALSESLSHFFFKIVAIVMEAAPIGAFGAMAFTIGRYGLHSLLVLGKLLLCAYVTSIGFIAIVLGLIAWAAGINLWRFLVYIREELLIVLGTSSSEPALPRLMLKLEHLGCSKTIVGLVVPAGYSFNLDGTSIYLTVATLFVAQATNTHLSFGQEVFILFILMLNSKGAAAVTGGGLITLTATLTSLSVIPVAGLSLLIGVDRFLSEMRSITNIIGNGVATIVIAKWEGQFDAVRARAILNGTHTAADDERMLRQNAGAL